MKDAYIQSYKFNKSFSGTDTLAFIILPGCTPVCLGSLTTISYSMLRNKRPVINIGRTNINGITRGSRIFAGTMIFTLINQHWLREIQDLPENKNWIGSIDELKADELPLFDIMIVSANEYGSWCSMYIYGIDVTDEAQTISVEDLFTENVFQFVARDVSTFKANSTTDLRPTGSGSKLNADQMVAVSSRTYLMPDSAATLDDVAAMERSYNQAKLLLDKELDEKKSYKQIARDLYESPSRYFIGNDVLEVQTMLSRLYDGIALNGIFDDNMDKAVRKYQSDIGVVPDGIVDQKLYNSLVSNTSTEGVRLATCTNRSGAYILDAPRSYANVVATIAYKDSVRIYDFVPSEEDDDLHRFYKTDQGFIRDSDLFSSYYESQDFGFPVVGKGYVGPYTDIVKEALQKKYNYSSPDGSITGEDEFYIKQFQKENFLPETGVLGQEEWILLEKENDDIKSAFSDDGFDIEFNRSPGEYTLNGDKVTETLDDFMARITCRNSINVKISATSKYPNGETKTVTTTKPISNQQTFNLMDCQKAFIYDPKSGSMPDTVEIVIYPYNKTPYKWFFNYKTGGAA